VNKAREGATASVHVHAGAIHDVIEEFSKQLR
jgi:hypothetical protein